MGKLRARCCLIYRTRVFWKERDLMIDIATYMMNNTQHRAERQRDRENGNKRKHGIKRERNPLEVVEKGHVMRRRQMCGVSMRGGVEVSVPWLALRSLAASRTGSKRLALGGAGELSPSPREEERDVVEKSERSDGCEKRAESWGSGGNDDGGV